MYGILVQKPDLTRIPSSFKKFIDFWLKNYGDKVKFKSEYVPQSEDDFVKTLSPDLSEAAVKSLYESLKPQPKDLLFLAIGSSDEVVSINHFILGALHLKSSAKYSKFLFSSLTEIKIFHFSLVTKSTKNLSFFTKVIMFGRYLQRFIRLKFTKNKPI